MRTMRSILGKKIIAASLLLSLCLSLVFPVFEADGHHGGDKYADWLRSQLGHVTSDAVELALTTALEHDAENLDVFIEAFVEAYARVSLDQEPATVTAVIISALHHHRNQLLDSAVTPHLLLKSALVRVTSAHDRTLQSWKAFERVAAHHTGRHLASSLWHVVSCFSKVIGTPISPRGP